MRKTMALVLSLFMLVPLASAQGFNPGTLPDSPFYGLDLAFERVSLALTFNEDAKAVKYLQYARERLEEARVMAGQDKDEFVRPAMIRYRANLNNAVERAQLEFTLSQVEQATTIHRDILDELEDEVPNEAKQAISRAIKESDTGAQRAKERIEEIKGGKEQGGDIDVQF